MNLRRRQFLHVGCALCAGLGMGSVLAQEGLSYTMPPKFERPDMSSDEGGLWGMMDREEKSLRRSALLLRDERLNRYIQDIACRLGGEHCSDVRVYLVRTPQFNASMAPNGVMQVWSGLLLRVANEAQLAAVLGHEIGHYLQRHSLARLRDMRDKAAVAQVMGLFGLAGAVGQMAVVASGMAYQRDHEREADRIGAILMHRVGYSVEESSRVWDGIQQERAARDGQAPSASGSMFDTHPPTPERKENLAAIARQLTGGTTGLESYSAQVSPFLDEWCEDELKRRQFDESIALFTRLSSSSPNANLMRCFRGEAYRLRGRPGDEELAFKDYSAASEQPGVPAPKAYRGMGLIDRQRQRRPEALQALRRYLELAPKAPDAGLIRSYIEEMQT